MKTAKLAWLFILCALLILLPVGNTSAYLQGEADWSKVDPCDVRAYVVDLPNGLNVRSGPGKTYKVIGKLPVQKVEGVEVHITGGSGEWVRIDRAVEEGGAPQRTLFHGAGWVYAPLLGATGKAITNGMTNLYEDRSTRSRVISRVSPDDDVTFLGCHGQWTFVKHKKKSGWAAPGTLCPNPLTTCV